MRSVWFLALMNLTSQQRLFFFLFLFLFLFIFSFSFSFSFSPSLLLFPKSITYSHMSCRKEQNTFPVLILLKAYRQKEWKSGEVSSGCQLTFVSSFGASQLSAEVIPGLFLLCRATQVKVGITANRTGCSAGISSNLSLQETAMEIGYLISEPLLTWVSFLRQCLLLG